MNVAAFLAGAVVGMSLVNVMWVRMTDDTVQMRRWNKFRDALRRTVTRKDTP